MAKRQRINQPSANKPSTLSGSIARKVCPLHLPRYLAIGLTGAIVVYLGYHPSDSIAVETGDAIWFCFAAILLWFLCVFESSLPKTHKTHSPFSAHLVSYLPWLVAGWISLSAIATSPSANLRSITNETWVWVAAACLFHAARTQLTTIEARRAIIGLLLAIASGLAVHGLHQYAVSLPQNRSDYRENPEMVLELAGIDAPEGSAERMIFENRLMDGGPSATFALANTLAGYLLVGSVLGGCLLMTSWPKQNQKQRILLATLTILCVSGLLATRSRTATIAILLAFGVLLITQIGLLRRQRHALIIGMSVLLGIVCIGVTYLGLYGNREWFEQAPASLAFRFQYWEIHLENGERIPVVRLWPGAISGDLRAIPRVVSK